MNRNIVFINGHIMTGELEQRPASAVAVRDGLIVAVGSDDDVKTWMGAGVEVIDLKGRTMAPGFNDSHCHPMGVGFSLQMVNAGSPPNVSIADITRRVAERVKETSPGMWVIGARLRPGAPGRAAASESPGS